jgi:hypothetical protein
MSGGDIIAVALAVAVLGAGTVALELRLPGKMAGERPSMAGEPLTGQVARHDSAVDNL